ncbi:chaperonin 10-like protein [Exophiala viscosa]|uniref:chaperonin 10-like protein n=1 Tax=Exophiala viscosa TaxID=2486360 RepID=UPI00218ED1B4|nr:chaperonin 10-like protein [Exophiala viscosa]
MSMIAPGLEPCYQNEAWVALIAKNAGCISIEAQNYGLIREGAGNAVLRAIPVPQLRDDYILVRTLAIALNPTDWTTPDAVGDDGTLVGCDYAGIMEEVGKAVKKPFKKGERIARFGHRGNDANPENGAFARYIAIKGNLQIHIPDSVSFEAACTVGVGVTTTGVCTLLCAQIAAAACGEGQDPHGSTATETITSQFAKLSKGGHDVLAQAL